MGNAAGSPKKQKGGDEYVNEHGEFHNSSNAHLLDDLPIMEDLEDFPTGPTGPVSRGLARNDTSYSVDVDDVIGDLGDESAIADSTAMFIMEFLPFCTGEDAQTMTDTLNHIKNTPASQINMNAQDAWGNTMLLLATQIRFVPAVVALLKRKADPDLVNESGISALVHASGEESYSPEVAKLLLKAKANPNIREHGFRCTAIHYAAGIQGADGLIKLLIKHKANTLVKDREGYQPLDYAVECDCTANAKVLKKAMKTDTELEEEEEEYQSEWVADAYESYEGFSDEMLAEIDGGAEGQSFASTNAGLARSATDNLMSNIEYETADEDAKMLMSTWKQLAWGMGAQKITKKMDDDIQEATRQLNLLKAEMDAAADSGLGATGRDKNEVVKRLRSSLAVVRKKVTNTKAKVLENNKKIAEASAHAGAQRTLWESKLEVKQTVNADLEDQIGRFKKEIAQLKSSNNNSVAAMRKRLMQQIQEEQARVDKAEEALALVETESAAFQSELEAEQQRASVLEQEVQNLKDTAERLKKVGGEINSGIDERVQKSRAKEAKKWRLHRSSSMRKIEEQKNHAEKEANKVKKSYAQEVHKRHQLKSVLDDMKGRSRAFCNFKYDSLRDEEAKTESKVADCLGPSLVLRKSDYSLDIKMAGRFVEFEMDFVYPECCPLVKLFPPLKPLCKKVVAGFSVCIFTLGSDFTGKSISMLGPTANARAAGSTELGIAGRTIKEIIKLSAREKKKFKVSLSMQMVEIVRDGEIVDLLRPDSFVEVKNDAGGAVVLKGAEKVPVENFEHAVALGDQALAKSSRAKDRGTIPRDNESDTKAEGRGSAASHIIQVFLVRQDSLKRKFSKTGKLTLIDTIDDTQTQELFAVVDAQAKATKKRNAPPPPARLSPLCKLFAEVIGGNCKTLMVMHTSRNDDKAHEIVQFVEMMKKVHNDCVANVETAALRKLKQQLLQLMELQSRRGAAPSQMMQRPSIHRPGGIELEE